MPLRGQSCFSTDARTGKLTKMVTLVWRPHFFHLAQPPNKCFLAFERCFEPFRLHSTQKRLFCNVEDPWLIICPNDLTSQDPFHNFHSLPQDCAPDWPRVGPGLAQGWLVAKPGNKFGRACSNPLLLVHLQIDG
jgi:hypothetical protein